MSNQNFLLNEGIEIKINSNQINCIISNILFNKAKPFRHNHSDDIYISYGKCDSNTQGKLILKNDRIGFQAILVWCIIDETNEIMLKQLSLKCKGYQGKGIFFQNMPLFHALISEDKLIKQMVEIWYFENINIIDDIDNTEATIGKYYVRKEFNIVTTKQTSKNNANQCLVTIRIFTNKRISELEDFGIIKIDGSYNSILPNSNIIYHKVTDRDGIEAWIETGENGTINAIRAISIEHILSTLTQIIKRHNSKILIQDEYLEKFSILSFDSKNLRIKELINQFIEEDTQAIISGRFDSDSFDDIKVDMNNVKMQYDNVYYDLPF